MNDRQSFASITSLADLVDDTQLTPSERSKLLFAVLFGQVVCGTLYLNISSFYPLHVAEHFEEQINAIMVAVALSAFEVAGIMCTPLIPKIMGCLGRKYSINFSFALLIISNSGLGLLELVPDDNWKLFWGLSVLVRFI